jgi:hypothetical protein
MENNLLVSLCLNNFNIIRKSMFFIFISTILKTTLAFRQSHIITNLRQNQTQTFNKNTIK